MAFIFVNNRTVKRVALDFEWPIGKGDVWKGYIPPPDYPCSHCKYGASEAFMHVEKHVDAMYFDRAARNDPHYKAILQALAGCAPLSDMLGHDVVAGNNAVLKLGELAGLPKNWYLCSHCGGDTAATRTAAAVVGEENFQAEVEARDFTRRDGLLNVHFLNHTEQPPQSVDSIPLDRQRFHHPVHWAVFDTLVDVIINVDLVVLQQLLARLILGLDGRLASPVKKR
jgi:hypothetical protein